MRVSLMGDKSGIVNRRMVANVDRWGLVGFMFVIKSLRPEVSPDRIRSRWLDNGCHTGRWTRMVLLDKTGSGW